jgi:hypothetical protein
LVIGNFYYRLIKALQIVIMIAPAPLHIKNGLPKYHVSNKKHQTIVRLQITKPIVAFGSSLMTCTKTECADPPKKAMINTFGQSSILNTLPLPNHILTKLANIEPPSWNQNKLC